MILLKYLLDKTEYNQVWKSLETPGEDSHIGATFSHFPHAHTQENAIVSGADNLLWNETLIQKYDLAGPRYTSYPTALQFSSEFTVEELDRAAAESRESGRPL